MYIDSLSDFVSVGTVKDSRLDTVGGVFTGRWPGLQRWLEYSLRYALELLLGWFLSERAGLSLLSKLRLYSRLNGCQWPSDIHT